MEDPYEQMRGSIIGTRPVYLAEHAGMFCDGLGKALPGHRIDFSAAEYVFEADEPYELYFEWRFGDVCAGVSVRADPDESEWFVHVSHGNRRSRYRKRVGDDPDASAEAFLSELERTLGGSL